MKVADCGHGREELLRILFALKIQSKQFLSASSGIWITKLTALRLTGTIKSFTRKGQAWEAIGRTERTDTSWNIGTKREG